MRFFIKRPAAVELFRERAGLPQTMGSSTVENCLRAVLSQAEASALSNLRVFTLDLREQVLFALGRVAPENKPYDVIIFRILTQAEYDELRRQETPERPRKRMRSRAMAA